MTDDSAAIDESHRQFVIHLIMCNRRQMRDQYISDANRYEAQMFLQSDRCVMFVRLLGLGESMTDQEIARSLIDGQGDKK